MVGILPEIWYLNKCAVVEVLESFNVEQNSYAWVAVEEFDNTHYFEVPALFWRCEMRCRAFAVLTIESVP